MTSSTTRQNLMRRLTANALPPAVGWLLLSTLGVGCAKTDVSTISTSPRNFVSVYDQSVGVEVNHSFLDLASCEIHASAVADGCVMEQRKTSLTSDECNQVKPLVAPERLAVYAGDEYSSSTVSGAGGSTASGLHADLPGGASAGGEVGAVLDNSAGSGSSACDGGTGSGYAREVASFKVDYVDATGGNYDLVFMFDGRSFSPETDAFVSLIRTLHSKYLPQ